MELIGLILGVVGIAISLAVAYWEHQKAKRAEARLEALAANLPETLLAGVRDALSSHNMANTNEQDRWSPPGNGTDQSPSLRSRYADLNGDGRDEVLIEVISGAHSSTLMVYGLDHWEFKKLAELHSTTMNGFDIQDSDGDGFLEVETVEIARRPDLPYVFGLRDRVTHKLVGDTFEEVGRVEGWDESDLKRISDEREANA